MCEEDIVTAGPIDNIPPEVDVGLLCIGNGTRSAPGPWSDIYGIGPLAVYIISRTCFRVRLFPSGSDGGDHNMIVFMVVDVD